MLQLPVLGLQDLHQLRRIEKTIYSYKTKAVTEKCNSLYVFKDIFTGYLPEDDEEEDDEDAAALSDIMCCSAIRIAMTTSSLSV